MKKSGVGSHNHMKKYILTILILFAVVPVAYANGFGIKLDQPVGNYIVNVDADTYSLASGDPINFSFMLWNKDRTEQVDFDNVWVSITPEGMFYDTFDGLLGKEDFGGFLMTYVFPSPGKYTLSVRYGKNKADGITTIAEASFPITVDPGSITAAKSDPKVIILALFAGAAVGIISVLFYKKTKRNR